MVEQQSFTFELNDGDGFLYRCIGNACLLRCAVVGMLVSSWPLFLEVVPGPNYNYFKLICYIRPL